MAGYEKYVVSVEHLESTERSRRKAFYTRVLGIYDNLDDAIEKYIDVTSVESPRPSKSEIQMAIEDIRDEEWFNDENNYYRYLSEEIHDWPSFYVGPGQYIIEKRRLS